MSHIVEIQSKLRDPVAIVAACRRLGLAEPIQGTATLFSGEATGLLVNLPGWQYPAVVDVHDGAVRFDTFGGRWGDEQHMDRLLQAYAVEKAKLEARRAGQVVSEQALADGSIKLTIQTG